MFPSLLRSVAGSLLVASLVCLPLAAATWANDGEQPLCKPVAMSVSRQITDERDSEPPQMPDAIADVDEAAHGNHQRDEWSDPFLDDARDTVVDDACNAYCLPPNRLWFDADYLMMWTNGNPIPPLVTTTRPVPPREQAGVLGSDNTQVLLGGKLVEGMRSGLRLTGGMTDNQFALLPELDLKVRLLLTEHLSGNIGYNLLFLTPENRTWSCPL